MSVIFEQGGAGAPFGTELATLTPQGASDTWHGACDSNTARRLRHLARSLRQEPRGRPAVGTGFAPEVAKAAAPSARN